MGGQVLAPRNRLQLSRGYRKPRRPLLDQGHPLSRGLIGCWLLGDDPIAAPIDISGYGNSGTISSGPLTLAASHHGELATKLNGTGFITLPAAVPATASLSVAMWINPTNLANSYSSLAFRFTSSTNDWQILLKSTGKLALYLSPGVANTNNIDPANISVSANVWTHVSFTWDGTTIRLYVNGVLDTAVAALLPGSLAGTIGTPLIGQDSQTAGRLFPGSVDGFRMYNRALSPVEIVALYSEPYAGISGFNFNLVGTAAVVGGARPPQMMLMGMG